MPGNLRVLRGRDHHKKKETVQVPPANAETLSESLVESLPPAVLRRARATLDVLEERKVLGVCDMEAFERYCQHLRLAYEANELLKRDGVIAVDDDGLPRKHPANQIHRDNSLAALRYEEQFGLTPSARMRLSRTDEQVKEDDYTEFRSKRATG
jgi:P27 family predicted phage terminase small subunit